MWLFFIIFAIIVVVGNAMILLHTAKKPKLPDNVKSQPYEDDDDDSSW